MEDKTIFRPNRRFTILTGVFTAILLSILGGFFYLVINDPPKGPGDWFLIALVVALIGGPAAILLYLMLWDEGCCTTVVDAQGIRITALLGRVIYQARWEELVQVGADEIPGKYDPIRVLYFSKTPLHLKARGTDLAQMKQRRELGIYSSTMLDFDDLYQAVTRYYPAEKILEVGISKGQGGNGEGQEPISLGYRCPIIDKNQRRLVVGLFFAFPLFDYLILWMIHLVNPQFPVWVLWGVALVLTGVMAAAYPTVNRMACSQLEVGPQGVSASCDGKKPWFSAQWDELAQVGIRDIPSPYQLNRYSVICFSKRPLTPKEERNPFGRLVNRDFLTFHPTPNFLVEMVRYYPLNKAKVYPSVR